jgi:hypothetical protein
MIYQADNIVKDVRVCMDENMADTALIADGDENTLLLNEIIKSKILEAVERVHTEAPFYMLDNAHHFDTNAAINWKTLESGEILLPDDFMRLVVFQMSDWERAVYAMITPADPDYAKTRCRVKALRGTAQRPVCALGMRNDGPVLEFYSCKDNTATITRSVYMPYPVIDNDNGIDISERCYTAVVYTAAALTLLTFGEKERAALFLENANNTYHRTS